MVLCVPDQRFSKSTRLCRLGKDHVSWRPLLQRLAQLKTGSVASASYRLSLGERGCRVVIQELGDSAGGTQKGMSAEVQGTPAVY